MIDGRKITAILPAYNEEQRILKALSGMPPEVDLALVVDDGSTDQTREISLGNGAYVITLPEHRNIDTAIRTGFEYALDNGFDIIVVMAGNGKDNAAEIPMLLHPIVKEDYDFVQGSRYLSGGAYENMPIHRTIGTRLYPILLRLSTGFPATDGTNGFRAFKSSILKDERIDIYQEWLGRTGMEFYLAMKVIQLGYKVTEVPVSKIYPYTDHYYSYTKVKPVKDWWNILKPLVYLTLRLRK